MKIENTIARFEVPKRTRNEEDVVKGQLVISASTMWMYTCVHVVGDLEQHLHNIIMCIVCNLVEIVSSV